jgi:hypothetical protein
MQLFNRQSKTLFFFFVAILVLAVATGGKPMQRLPIKTVWQPG